MFLLSVLAGMIIGLGGIIYLSIGNIIGALLFSIGLVTIITFNLNLFTGKAGLLATKKITFRKLLLVWFGNMLGCAIVAKLFTITYAGQELIDMARHIMFIRLSNFWYENIILGIFCGILMYIAVNIYTKNALITSACVASFILCGMNHCIADMFYYFMSVKSYWAFDGFAAIIFTTIGNIIGCNIIPMFLCQSQKSSASSSSKMSSSSSQTSESTS